MKTTSAVITVVRGLLAIILLFLVIGLAGSLFADPVSTAGPASSSFSVISINGTITGQRPLGGAGYDHQATINYVKNLAGNPYDRGILLYMNTPGGTIFHSDELYLKLLWYKEETGRPVYAYMSELCASGGYYISLAADYVFANRVTMTGSLGVISTMFDTSELFGNIGIRTVLIDSGEHKAAGTLGTVITPGQEAVLKEMTDEFYGLFTELIANGRDMDIQTVKGLADGRIYTANQALTLGLIDEISTWNNALEEFEALTGAAAFHPELSAETTFMGRLLVRAPDAFRSGSQNLPLSGINALPRGVPLVIAPEFLN
jgi:protease-4